MHTWPDPLPYLECLQVLPLRAHAQPRTSSAALDYSPMLSPFIVDTSLIINLTSAALFVQTLVLVPVRFQCRTSGHEQAGW